MTPEQLKAILPRCNNPREWAPLLSDILPIYGFKTNHCIAMFLAQTGHESAHYNTLEENLNYSRDGLRKVFSKYFPNDDFAAKYARQPEKIANRVYANRMGNGDERSGDGWLYRGRGILQITGKSNYTYCSRYLFGDERLVTDPSLLLEPEYAIKSACWFWNVNELNIKCSDVVLTTRIINGGKHGLQDRTNLYEKALKVLNEIIYSS